MKTQIIALEAYDDLISVRDRMSWAKSPRILLVWPKYEKITLRAVDLRILQQHASYLGAEMGIITRRGEVRRDAERFGIPVFGSAAAAQRDAWPASPLPHPFTARRPRRERSELEGMRQATRPREAGWRSTLLARFGFFVLAVLAVLAVAGLFVPEAVVALKPLSQRQSITLPVTASAAVRAVSVAGSLPVHEITVTVSAAQTAQVTTQGSIPDSKASGIVRFVNLTQSDVRIPAGTIVYSLSPSAVQFATLNDTRVPGNVNAMVEVPISSVKGGAAGNLPANSIQAVEGSLSLALAVTNPKPTDGGSDRSAAVPSEADRQRLHDVLAGVLKDQAQRQIRDSIGAGDVVLPGSLNMGQVAEETYEPSPGQPGNILRLTLGADYSAQYLKAEELQQLADATLNASIPQGFVPQAGSMTYSVDGIPTQNEAGAWLLNLHIERTLAHELNMQRAGALIRGRSPAAASANLQAALALAEPPEITLSPAWWPWLPLVPFRLTFTAVQ